MADRGNDPAVVWQSLVSEMEKGFNAFATQTMASPEFSRAMNTAGGVSAGLQKQLVELMEKYLTSMNLPSRAQMIGMSERLQNIESQLSEITSLLREMRHGDASETGSVSRPPRTKQPPSGGGSM